MNNDINKERIYKIGDMVIIKDDNIVDAEYKDTLTNEGDIFTETMAKFCGEKARVIDYTYIGYKLDVDPMHTYTDSMLQAIGKDDKEVRNKDVDEIIYKSKSDYYKKRIDEALDSGMYKSNPKEFEDIINEYNRYTDKLLKRG